MLGGSTLLDYLVIDTGPLIRNIKLERLAEKVVTTSGVVAEVRDAFTRQKLEMLPMDIEERSPSDQSLQFVLDFAKKTGDIRSLSKTDMAVVALTYDLESKLNGVEHLRNSPVGTIKVNEGFGDDRVTNLAGFYVPKNTDAASSRTTSVCSTADQSSENQTDHCNLEIITEDSDAEDDTNLEDNSANIEVDQIYCDDDLGEGQIDEELEKELEQGFVKHFGQCELDEGWTTVPKKGGKKEEEIEERMNVDDILIPAVEDLPDDDYEFDENEDDWITPSNISEKKTESLASIKVGCATTDFAMQNLLLQIGLHVVSVDGILIKYAKTYVLKCTACFTIVKDCSKMFCTKCGNKTLEKVAVTVDDEGVTWYQRLSRKPRTGRGVRYSLPKPTGGRQSNMPWITPDQPDKIHKASCNVKHSVDVMSGDYVKSSSPFGMTNVDVKAFKYRQVAGRHGNPNERTKRTGNRKKKKK